MPQVQNQWGVFAIKRKEHSAKFVCAICERKSGSSKAGEKVSKTVGGWTTPTGAKLPVCNGCFGTATQMGKNPASAHGKFADTVRLLLA